MIGGWCRRPLPGLRDVDADAAARRCVVWTPPPPAELSEEDDGDATVAAVAAARAAVATRGRGAIAAVAEAADAGAQRGAAEAAAALAMWRGDVGGALAVLTEADALTGDFVSISAMAGRDVWEAATRAYAAQLQRRGDAQMAALQYLAIHDVEAAVRALSSARLWADAAALSAARLLPAHPLVATTRAAAAAEAEGKGQFEAAGEGFLAAKQPERAVRALCRRAGAPLARAAAAAVAVRSGGVGAAEAYAVLHHAAESAATHEWPQADRTLVSWLAACSASSSPSPLIAAEEVDTIDPTIPAAAPATAMALRLVLLTERALVLFHRHLTRAPLAAPAAAHDGVATLVTELAMIRNTDTQRRAVGPIEHSGRSFDEFDAWVDGLHVDTDELIRDTRAARAVLRFVHGLWACGVDDPLEALLPQPVDAVGALRVLAGANLTTYRHTEQPRLRLATAVAAAVGAFVYTTTTTTTTTVAGGGVAFLPPGLQAARAWIERAAAEGDAGLGAAVDDATVVAETEAVEWVGSPAVRLFCPRLLRHATQGGGWERLAGSSTSPAWIHPLVTLEAWWALCDEWRSTRGASFTAAAAPAASAALRQALLQPRFAIARALRSCLAALAASVRSLRQSGGGETEALTLTLSVVQDDGEEADGCGGGGERVVVTVTEAVGAADVGSSPLMADGPVVQLGEWPELHAEVDVPSAQCLR